MSIKSRCSDLCLLVVSIYVSIQISVLILFALIPMAEKDRHHEPADDSRRMIKLITTEVKAAFQTAGN